MKANAPVSDALEEVVVTAERVATNIQTTPIAITAISGDQLKDMQLVTVTDLQKSVPNLQVLDAGPYQSINIRGIGNTAITPSIVPGVAVTHDGLLSPETIFIGEPFMDIADVEVLRGPQGTLVGASSTGGAVQIKSKDPDFKGVNGYAELKLGNYQDRQVTAAINLPINDAFAARIAVNYEDRKSFSRNDANLSPQALGAYPLGEPGSVHDRNARIGLLWKPSDKYQAVLKMTLNSSNTEGTAGEPNQRTFTTTGTCPDLTAGPVCHSLYYNWSTHKPYEINYNLPYSVQATTANRYSLDQIWSMSNGMSVRSLTGVQNLDGGDRWQDDDFSSAPAATHYKDVGPNNVYYSQEFEVKSKQDQPVSWIAGAIWFYRDTPVSNTSFGTANFFANPTANTNESLARSQGIVPYDVLLGGTRIGYSSTHTVQRTEGLYANLKWQINSKLDLQVGIRGNWDQNFVHVPDGIWPGLPPGFNFVRLDPGAPVAPNPAATPPVAGDACGGLGAIMVGNVQYHCTFKAAARTQQSDSIPTGKIGLNWEPIDGQFLYAFYARGYKSGGVRIRSTSPGARPFGDYPTIPTAPRNGFKPETVDDFELGWKSTMFDNHLRTSLGLYYMNYHDMQLPQFNPALAANGVDNIQSASTISGVEFTANGRFGGWGTDLSFTLGHSKLGSTDLVATYRTPASFGGQVQCPLTAGVCSGPGVDYTPYVVHLNGVEQPYSPKVSANLAVNYRFPVGDDGEIMPQINYAYTGSQFTQVYQAPADGNYFVLDARRLWNLSVKYSTGQWESQIYCNNCGNEVWIAGDGGVSQGNVWYYGSPRQFGIRFNRKF